MLAAVGDFRGRNMQVAFRIAGTENHTGKDEWRASGLRCEADDMEGLAVLSKS